MNRKETAKIIVESIDYKKMVSDYPEPGRYVITGPQANFQDYERYFGYVIQVRRKAGAFGTDIVLIRHPDGSLCAHENQAYFYVEAHIKKLIKSLFPEDCTPDNEDYSKPYCLAYGEFPETGRIIEPKKRQTQTEGNAFKITTLHSDGSKTIEVIVD